MNDIRKLLGLRKVINAAGPVSVLGGGVPGEAATAAAMAILPLAVDMAQLHAIASDRIAAAFACEAGLVTAGAAAGIAVSVAATITGLDPALVQRLPDTASLKRRVILQRGHDADFGARVSQMIRLTGAELALIGTADQCDHDDLRRALGSAAAAAVFVVSHHAAQRGMIALADFCAICRASRVPVIVDAAGEHDPRVALDAGADIVIVSGHKNFGALTAGIVAGRRALIDACRLQDAGIGRPMKVGKEGIAGVIAAMADWQHRDLRAMHADWKRRAALAVDALCAVSGLRVELAADLPGSPLFRARIHARHCEPIVDALADGNPSIRVWRHGLAHGYFELDPRALDDEQMLAVCRTIGALAGSL